MSNAIKYALIYVIAAFAWSCVEYLTGLQSTRIALHPYFVTPFYLLLTGVIYYLAVKEKRASDGGKIGFGKIVVFGMTLTGLILVLNLVHFYVFNKLINPDFFPAMARHAVETTNIAPADAEKYYSFNNLLVQGSIYRAVMGIVATLITAFTMKSSPKRKSK